MIAPPHIRNPSVLFLQTVSNYKRLPHALNTTKLLNIANLSVALTTVLTRAFAIKVPAGEGNVEAVASGVRVMHGPRSYPSFANVGYY